MICHSIGGTVLTTTFWILFSRLFYTRVVLVHVPRLPLRWDTDELLFSVLCYWRNENSWSVLVRLLVLSRSSLIADHSTPDQYTCIQTLKHSSIILTSRKLSGSDHAKATVSNRYNTTSPMHMKSTHWDALLSFQKVPFLLLLLAAVASDADVATILAAAASSLTSLPHPCIHPWVRHIAQLNIVTQGFASILLRSSCSQYMQGAYCCYWSQVCDSVPLWLF